MRYHTLADCESLNLAQLKHQSCDDVVPLGLGLAQKEHSCLAVMVGKGLRPDAHRAAVFGPRQTGEAAARVGTRRLGSERIGLVIDAAFGDPHPHMPVSLQIGPWAFWLVDRDLIEIRSAEPDQLSIEVGEQPALQ